MNKQYIIDRLVKEEPNNYNLFVQILDRLSEDNKDTLSMIELGCGSAYYSAIFHETFKHKAKNILVEPNIQWWKDFGETYFSDKKNFYFFNNYIENLIWAHWGGPNDAFALQLQKETPQISIEQILQDTNTEYADILHMDMQGSEYYVLDNIIKSNLITKFNYIFIMTHDFNDINYQSYIKLLTDSKLSYELIHNNENYRENGDGLIILKMNINTNNNAKSI